MIAMLPVEQGAEFEVHFCAFLDELIPDLGYRWVDRPKLRQGGRPQGGRDIDARWRDNDEHEVSWRFECKAHNTGSLVTRKEALPKLIDTIADEGSGVDCWCGVAPKTEFVDSINDVVAKLNGNVSTPCSLDLWTYTKRDMPSLIECYPEHYRNIFKTDPADVDAVEKGRRLQLIRDVIERCSEEGRERRARIGDLTKVSALRGELAENCCCIHLVLIARMRTEPETTSAEDYPPASEAAICYALSGKSVAEFMGDRLKFMGQACPELACPEPVEEAEEPPECPGLRLRARARARTGARTGGRTGGRSSVGQQGR
jgi:hypothetical protein